MNFLPKKHFFVVIFLLSFSLRYIAFINKPCLSLDSIYYLNSAQTDELSIDVLQSYWRLPYILFLKIGPFLGIDTLKFGIFMNIFFGSVSCILAMLLANQIFHSSGFFTGVCFSVFPYFIEWNTELQRESLYILLILFSLIFYILYVYSFKIKMLIFTLFFSFLAYLIRVEGIELIFGVLIATFLLFLRKKINYKLYVFLFSILILILLFCIQFFLFYSFAKINMYDILCVKIKNKIIHS